MDWKKQYDDATAKIEYLRSDEGWIEGVMKYGMYSYYQILSLLYDIKSLSKKLKDYRKMEAVEGFR